MFFASLQRNRKNPGASHFLVRRLRRDKPSNRGSRANASFRGSIRRRAGRWRPLSTSGPDFFNRFPTMCLQVFSTTPDPTGNPRLRQRSQRIRSALASQQEMQAAAGSRHSSGFAHMKIGNREQLFPRPMKSAAVEGPAIFRRGT